MTPPKYTRLPARFWSKVEPDADGCWVWTAFKDQLGYGRFHLRGRPVLAHRAAWIDRYGPFPHGRVTDHLCRVPACVRPDHLEAVPMRVNTMRGRLHDVLRARWAAMTHFKCGHEINAANEGFKPSGGHRYCKECSRQYARESARRRRGLP